MRDAVTTARFPSAFLPEGLTMGIDDANTVDRGRRLKSFRHSNSGPNFSTIDLNVFLLPRHQRHLLDQSR